MNLMCTVRAEIVKAVSLRVPVYVAAVTAMAVVGLSWLLTSMAQRAFAAGRPNEVGGIEPAIAFTTVLEYGQIGIILFGCWLMYEEHDRGNLRTSLLATPTRGQLFTAKAIVAAMGSFVISVVTVLGTYGVRCLLVGNVPVTKFGGMEDARVLVGYIAYWTLLGVIAFAVSAAVRNGLVGLGALLAIVTALSAYLLSLTSLARFLPDQAGAQIYHLAPSATGGSLGPTLGLAVVCAWVIAAFIAGCLSFRTWAVRH